MTLDLLLLPDPVGESSLKASDGERKDTGDSSDSQAWDAIVSGVRDVVGEVVLGEDGPNRTLTHQASGITVRYRSGEAAVNLPFWHSGADAEWFVRTTYRIGHVVADATGLVAHVSQLGVPLTEAESSIGAAVDVLFEEGPVSSHLWPRDGIRVYFTGPATLADAAQRLRSMVVAEENDRLTVQWDDGPQLEVTFEAGPRIAIEAAEVAEDYGIPEMAAYDRRFQVTFDDLDEVLQETNTLIDVTLHLQDLTGGYVRRSWNDEVSPPYDS
ncbi:hypothetical protein ACLQ2S_13080 [Micromonospora sp. DT48]|uniref:hypothetical protein n=1 Tax=unclassified Micromonospora TaxID=2617518 RepID=UPI0012BC75F4|nr:hypothetical protein [Micromonospora sp. CP22]MTK03977.1 hypothetical protein [Micromonospora sp. CP22]